MHRGRKPSCRSDNVEWQGDRKSSATVLVAHLDLAARFDEAARDRQSESGAAPVPGRVAPERDPRTRVEIRLRDAAAGVEHRHERDVLSARPASTMTVPSEGV